LQLVQGKRPRDTGWAGKVLHFLETAEPLGEMSYEDLTAEMLDRGGVEKVDATTTRQVAVGVSELKNRYKAPIITTNGRFRVVWAEAKEVSPTKGKKVFEEVGRAKDGRLIIQSDNGELYFAEEV
jgi:hypothetical protein